MKVPKPDEMRGVYRKLSSRERSSRPRGVDLPHTNWRPRQVRRVGMAVLAVNLILFLGNFLMIASGVEMPDWWGLFWIVVFGLSHVVLIFGETMFMRPIPWGGICFGLLWLGPIFLGILSHVLHL